LYFTTEERERTEGNEKGKIIKFTVRKKNSDILNMVERSGSFYSNALSPSGMDDLFLNRMLFEWLREG
jgi:hypothetical protein